MKKLAWGVVGALLFSFSARAAEPLPDRFQTLRCAVVHIVTKEGTGTGFFFDNAGDVMTAAHVVYDRQWSLSGAGDEPSLALVAHSEAKLFLANGEALPLSLPTSPTAEDIVDGKRDIAILRTGTKPPCALPVGDARTLRVGDHLLAIGYPEVAPSGVLYEGFLSALYPHPRIPIGHVGATPIYTNAAVLRVQMPIVPGASGSPVINDSNEVVGVVSEVPVLSFQDIEEIIQAYESGQSHMATATIAGFNLNQIVADLAFTMKEFETPGSAYAVPLCGAASLRC